MLCSSRIGKIGTNGNRVTRRCLPTDQGGIYEHGDGNGTTRLLDRWADLLDKQPNAGEAGTEDCLC